MQQARRGRGPFCVHACHHPARSAGKGYSARAAPGVTVVAKATVGRKGGTSMTATLPSRKESARTRPAEELAFQPSHDTSIGVELELQILDRETGDLAPGAVPLLKAAAEEALPGMSAELMQSMIEVKTGICHSVAEARDELLPTLKKLSHLATSLGYDLAMAGTHPFHRTTTSAVFPAERYERIMDRLAWLTYQRVVFGLHIHVGVPSGDRAIAVI